MPNGQNIQQSINSDAYAYSTQSLISVKDSEPTYSSTNSLKTNEDNDALNDFTDDDEDKLTCEISLNADNYRLCTAKAAQNPVFGRIDASLVKKTLTAIEAPHLGTKSLITKLDDNAKTVDSDISTIPAEQIKDSILGTVRSWLRKGISPAAKSPEFQQSKGLLRYCQEFDRLLIEKEGQLLCYNEPSHELEDEILRICLPLLLFLACFSRGHYNDMGRHMGQKRPIMPNDSNTGLARWTGKVHSLLII